MADSNVFWAAESKKRKADHRFPEMNPQIANFQKLAQKFATRKRKVRSVPFKRRHVGITECYKFYVHICCRNGSHNGAITVIVIFLPIGKQNCRKKIKGCNNSILSPAGPGVYMKLILI